MQRLCFTFQLCPGTEAEYKRRRDEIWLELVEAIHDAGYRNYSLFRRCLEVVAYVECHPDAASAFATLADNEANARWSEWFQHVIVR